MKTRKGLPAVAWILLAVLVVAAATMLLGRSDNLADPSATSTAPSGTRALISLLQDLGYEVSITRYVKPRLKGDELVVGFFVDRFDLGGQMQENIERAGDFVYDHLRDGGNALLFGVQEGFRDASRGAQVREVRVPGDPGTLKVTSFSEASPSGLAGIQTGTSAPFATSSSGRFGEISRVGDGTMLLFDDGIFGTNRFIDQNDNAEVIARAVATVLPEGGKIVFLEAAHGSGTEESLAQAIGGWASFAWYQLIFLLLVIVYTLGKRFGLPEEERFKQTGSRELVDAVSWTFHRAKATPIALQAVLSDCDRRIRQAIKLPMDASPHQRNAQLPPELADQFVRAMAAVDERIPVHMAARIAKDLDHATDEFTRGRQLHGDRSRRRGV